ncbi:MAG: TetR/AcrR family transcriptional regulator [Oscillochloridaceae bacterium umkhey_bin13]
MGRKSLVEERRVAILAAFERCIARDGLDVPLDRIAEEAGMPRSLIRHYLGNRDEMVMQVVYQIATTYPERIVADLAQAAARGEAALLDLFFGDGLTNPAWDEVLHAVLSAPPQRYPEARATIAAMFQRICDSLARVLGQLYPTAPSESCTATAYGLLCLMLAHDDLRWLGLPLAHAQLARSQALILLRALA